MVINYKGNMKWYLDNHITWLSNDDINYSKGNMEYNRDVYDTWRIGDYEEAMGGELEEEDEEDD